MSIENNETAVNENRAEEFARIAAAALEDKKGEDVRVLDISKVSVMADYFVIASGGSPNQVEALVDNVDEKLGRAGARLRQVEGRSTSGWVLMDYGDVIVHIFDKDNRLFYDLERIWQDGRRIDV